MCLFMISNYEIRPPESYVPNQNKRHCRRHLAGAQCCDSVARSQLMQHPLGGGKNATLQYASRLFFVLLSIYSSEYEKTDICLKIIVLETSTLLMNKNHKLLKKVSFFHFYCCNLFICFDKSN